MRRSHCCRHGKLGQICRRRAAASGECGCATAQGVARLCYCPTCFGPLFYGFVKSMSIFNGDAILIGCIVWDAGLRHAVLSLPASGTNYYPESKGTGDNPLASAHSPGAARGGTCHQRCGVWCAEEPRGSPPACCSFSLLLRWRLQLAPAPHSTGSDGQQMARTCCQIGQNWQNEKLWQHQMVEVRLDVVGSGYSSQNQPSQLASTSTAYGYKASKLSW